MPAPDRGPDDFAREQPSPHQRAARAREATHVALREGLAGGALSALAAGAAHVALARLAPAAYARATLQPLKRIAATVLVLGGAWGSANAGYARATIAWNR